MLKIETRYVIVDRNSIPQYPRLFKSVRNVMKHIEKNNFKHGELFYKRIDFIAGFSLAKGE